MKNEFFQFKFRNHLGKIESKKEALARLKEIKNVKDQILRITNEKINKNSLKFNMYKNDKKHLIPLLEQRLISIMKQYKIIKKQINEEFISVDHVNTKIIFNDDDDKKIVSINNTRSVEGKEKKLHNKLLSLKNEETKIKNMLNYLFNDCLIK